MLAKHFEAMLAKQAEISASEADQRMRPLREAGVLPVAGRGRHAPSINALHASYMLLSMVSRRAVDAAGVALKAAGLVAAKSPLAAQTKLGVLLAYLLQNPDDDWMRRLMISEDGCLAWMVSDLEQAGEQWLWSTPEALEELKTSGCDVANFGRGSMGRWFAIGGGAIAQLGIKIQQKTQSGWIEPALNIELPKREKVEV